MNMRELRDLLTLEIEKDESVGELELYQLNYCADYGLTIDMPDAIQKAFFIHKDGYIEKIDDEDSHKFMVNEIGDIIRKIHATKDCKNLPELEINGFYFY